MLSSKQEREQYVVRQFCTRIDYLEGEKVWIESWPEIDTGSGWEDLIRTGFTPRTSRRSSVKGGQ